MDYLPLISALVGTLLGGGIAILGQAIDHRQRRRAELNHIIQERRIAAYEQLIGKVEYFGFGIVAASDYSAKRHPLVLEEPDKLGDWKIGLMTLRTTAGHLIDSELGFELKVLDEYVMRLEELIDKCRLDNGEYDLNRVHAIGQEVYPDFQTLKKRVLIQIGKFFSHTMYKTQFIPDMQARWEEPLYLPEFVKDLVLFKNAQKLDKLARSGESAKS